MEALDVVQVVVTAVASGGAAWGAMRVRVQRQGEDIAKLQADVDQLPGASEVSGISKGLSQVVQDLRAIPEQVERRVAESIGRVDAKASTAHRRIDELERGDIKALTDRLTRLEERAEAHERANGHAMAALTQANADLNQTVKDIKTELQGAITSIDEKLDRLLLGGQYRGKVKL